MTGDGDGGPFDCRFDGCQRVFDTRRGRGIHESQKHDYEHRGEWHDEDYLRAEYHGKGKSVKELADENDIAYNRMLRSFEELGVERRDSVETRHFDTRKKLSVNREDIISRYKSGEPMYELGEDYGVQDHTIKRFLRRQGVDTRNHSEQLKKSFSSDRVESLDVDTPQELLDPDWLRKVHIDEGMSTREIGRELDCSGGTVARWLRKHDIEVRARSRAVELARRDTPGIHTGENGYEYINHSGHGVRHHRLLATLLVDDISELRGMHVHHKTGVEWDNRLSQLKVLDFKNHMAEHREAAYE